RPDCATRRSRGRRTPNLQRVTARADATRLRAAGAGHRRDRRRRGCRRARHVARMGERTRRRRTRNAVSGHLTRGRIAAGVVALVTLAALVALVAVAAPRWWRGDGGTYAPRTPL